MPLNVTPETVRDAVPVLLITIAWLADGVPCVVVPNVSDEALRLTTGLTPLWRLQMFAAVQPYRFDPAGAAVLKNNWPTTHEDGNAVPVVTGLVSGNDEKSAFRPCVPRLMVVV